MSDMSDLYFMRCVVITNRVYCFKWMSPIEFVSILRVFYTNAINFILLNLSNFLLTSALQ